MPNCCSTSQPHEENQGSTGSAFFGTCVCFLSYICVIYVQRQIHIIYCIVLGLYFLSMSYPLGPVPCNDGSEFWDSLSAPGACKGIQCHHGLAWWDPARCGTAGLQGTATVTHMYVIILISCLAIAVRNGWQELGNDGDGRRVLGVMVEAVLHAKGKIPDSMSYWLVCQTILVCVCGYFFAFSF